MSSKSPGSSAPSTSASILFFMVFTRASETSLAQPLTWHCHTHWPAFSRGWAGCLHEGHRMLEKWVPHSVESEHLKQDKVFKAPTVGYTIIFALSWIKVLKDSGKTAKAAERQLSDSQETVERQLRDSWETAERQLDSWETAESHNWDTTESHNWDTTETGWETQLRLAERQHKDWLKNS